MDRVNLVFVGEGERSRAKGTTSERRWRREGGKKMAEAPLSLIAWGWTKTATEKAEGMEDNHFLLRVSFTVLKSVAEGIATGAEHGGGIYTGGRGDRSVDGGVGS